MRKVGTSGNNNQVKRAHQRDAGENVVDEVRSTLAGADAGNKRARLAEVIGDVVRLHHDRYVEIRKEDDAQHVQELHTTDSRAAWPA